MNVFFCFVCLLHTQNCLPREVVVEQRKEIQDTAVFTGNVERDAPLHEADVVRIVIVGNHKPNAGFGEVVERLGVVV